MTKYTSFESIAEKINDVIDNLPDDIAEKLDYLPDDFDADPAFYLALIPRIDDELPNHDEIDYDDLAITDIDILALMTILLLMP